MTMRLVKRFSLVFWLSLLTSLSAQSPGTLNSRLMLHATVVPSEDGSVTVTANSPRPLLQALTAIRRHYGWIIDYEESRYPTTEIVTGPNRRLRLSRGSFMVRLAGPGSVGNTKDEATFLLSLINQSSRSIKRRFMLTATASSRFTVVTADNQKQLMLDTPIHLPRATRSISETVDTILNLVTLARGTPIIRGGFVDNGLLQQDVTVGGGESVPARDLLTQALDRSSIAKVWLVTFSPSEDAYYIGIQSAVREITTASGEVKIVPVRNQNPSSPK